MKRPFCFIIKALFVVELFKLLSRLFFWSRRKNGLIRIIRLISKFMASQTGQQTIEIHILLNITQIKDNKTIKFGQYNKGNIFLQKSCRYEAGKLVPRPFLFFKKLYMR